MNGRHGAHRHRGFTLIELIVVMSIIGLLSALAYPRMTGSYYALKINGAARKLQSDIRYAQQAALNSHLKVDVVLDTANDRYRVADVAAGANITDPYTRSVGVAGQDWTTGLRVTYTTDAELKGIDLSSATAATLRFSTIGHPTDTADTALTGNFDIVITFQGLSKTVRVTPNTGVVTVL